MAKTFLATDKIGNIVANYPQTLNVFKELNIDFCCGGNRELEIAAQEAGLSSNALIDKLSNAVKNEAIKTTEQFDALQSTQSELIEHIVKVHHEYLRKTIPELSSLIEKILRAHGDRHGKELSIVKKLFADLGIELLKHLDKEEHLVFPLIAEYEEAPAANVYNAARLMIADIESEHENAGDILKELRKITSQYTVPKDGCPTFALTYRKLEELESDTFKHIHFENNILIPRFHERKN
ncbi:MAG: protein of unknown function ScdA domain protein [Clostridia bacterium]|nr:protein of unknown function ScdA domain protein [Clostridia bacterium]